MQNGLLNSSVTHFQDLVEARQDPLVDGMQSQVEEVRRQGTSLRDSLGSPDVMHRALRIREVQVIRPVVEGPDKGSKLREVSLEHPDDPSAISGVEGVLDIGADGDHRGRPELVEAVSNAGHNVTARGGGAALLPDFHAFPKRLLDDLGRQPAREPPEGVSDSNWSGNVRVLLLEADEDILAKGRVTTFRQIGSKKSQSKVPQTLEDRVMRRDGLLLPLVLLVDEDLEHVERATPESRRRVGRGCLDTEGNLAEVKAAAKVGPRLLPGGMIMDRVLHPWAEARREFIIRRRQVAQLIGRIGRLVRMKSFQRIDLLRGALNHAVRKE